MDFFSKVPGISVIPKAGILRAVFRKKPLLTTFFSIKLSLLNLSGYQFSQPAFLNSEEKTYQILNESVFIR